MTLHPSPAIEPDKAVTLSLPGVFIPSSERGGDHFTVARKVPNWLNKLVLTHQNGNRAAKKRASGWAWVDGQTNRNNDT